MKKLAVSTVLVLCMLMGLVALGAAQDQEKMKSKMGSAKTARWHGIIIRSNKDESTLTVRREGIEKKVQYDSSTKWTRLNKPAEMGEFKDGADVICLGTYDEKGVLHATRIDLRRD
jgi:hypothetical protein